MQNELFCKINSNASNKRFKCVYLLQTTKCLFSEKNINKDRNINDTA